MANKVINAQEDGEPRPETPTSKEALGDVAPQRPTDDPSAAPAGYMKSTWHENQTHWSLLFSKNPLQAVLYDLMYRGPVTKRKGKIPVHSTIAQHAFVFPRALPPMIYHYWSMKTGQTWSLEWALFVYTVYFILFSKMTLSHFNRLVEKYGTLDNNYPRDKVPDTRVLSTVIALISYAAVRPVIGILLVYDQEEWPALNPWLPVHAVIFTTLMDFYFYIYHRAMHEIDFLWRFHKVHHMSKHPSSILSAFADVEQDIFDIFVIPAITLITYKVDFFTWWVCQCYILFVEASGHSGTRAFIQAPVGSPVLQLFGWDLLLEDHDLHHRNGWRKSSNYGKQTRIWDVLFGSTRKRVECLNENVDWNDRGDFSDMLL